MNANDIEKAVNSIEHDIYNSTGVEYYNITFTTNGYCQTVEFCGILLWSSEDDSRRYYDKTDEYEDLEGYLRRALNEEITKIAKIIV